MKQDINKKIVALEAELRYCLYKQQGDKVIEHWFIRELEIKEELKLLKLKVGKNVKTQTRLRKTVRKS